MLFGIITSDVKSTTYKNTYSIKVESINGNKKYKDTNLYVYTKPDEFIKYGKKVSFTRRIYKAK